MTFDPQGARDARDAAVAQVARNSAAWRAIATRALLTVARRQEILASDDVWAELDRRGVSRPAEGRAMGPVMKEALRDGVVEAHGYTQGTQVAHHGDVMRTYRSLVYGDPDPAWPTPGEVSPLPTEAPRAAATCPKCGNTFSEQRATLSPAVRQGRCPAHGWQSFRA